MIQLHARLLRDAQSVIHLTGRSGLLNFSGHADAQKQLDLSSVLRGRLSTYAMIVRIEWLLWRKYSTGSSWPVTAIYLQIVGQRLPVRSSLNKFTSPISHDKFLLLTES
jgi:hypothetical protein